MGKYFQAELLKQKRSFNRVLVWLAPLVTILLTVVLMRGRYLQDSAYNWWYMMILPGSLTMFSAFTTVKERRKNRHGLFGVAARKWRLWTAQILVCALYLFLTCVLFWAYVAVGSFLFGGNVILAESLTASIVLFITFAWQIPLWMLLAEKTGVVTTVFASLIINNLAAIVAAAKSFWWVVPFAIPSRLMCACIHVRPNGLPVEEGNSLTDGAVMVPGILISLSLFVILTVATSVWFERCEV